MYSASDPAMSPRLRLSWSGGPEAVGLSFYNLCFIDQDGPQGNPKQTFQRRGTPKTSINPLLPLKLQPHIFLLICPKNSSENMRSIGIRAAVQADSVLPPVRQLHHPRGAFIWVSPSLAGLLLRENLPKTCISWICTSARHARRPAPQGCGGRGAGEQKRKSGRK